jgi:hypothetical protein
MRNDSSWIPETDKYPGSANSSIDHDDIVLVHGDVTTLHLQSFPKAHCYKVCLRYILTRPEAALKIKTKTGRFTVPGFSPQTQSVLPTWYLFFLSTLTYDSLKIHP